MIGVVSITQYISIEVDSTLPECFKCGRAVLKLFVVALQELFVKYSWNSFLHSQVEQCVFMVLNNPPTEGKDKAEHLLLQLVQRFV